MNALVAAALEIETQWRQAGWKACIIGGLAVLRWGEPRTTQDVDVTLLTGYGGEEPYVDALLAEFTPRIPEAREFALRHRVLLLESRDGVPIDVALGAMPFEERAMDVEGIVARQRGRIDARLVFDELAPLIELKGSIDTKQRLEKLLPS